MFSQKQCGSKPESQPLTLLATFSVSGCHPTLSQLWGAKNFPMYAYKGNEAMRVLNDCSELVTELEDNMMNLTMMANSAFAGHFKDDLRRWERDLSTVLDSLDVWQVRL